MAFDALFVIAVWFLFFMIPLYVISRLVDRFLK